MAMHIVLVEPEIPPNTGNIARTCAATGSKLHLVKPLGFSLDEKSLRRAGLDYWSNVEVKTYKNIKEFFHTHGGKRMFFATTKAKSNYVEVRYEDEDMLVFGKETRGLPDELIKKNESSAIRIPMGESAMLRSLNVSNAVNIILFEALRQMGFPLLR